MIGEHDRTTGGLPVRLRDALKKATADLHRAVERQFETLDIRTIPGMTMFLQAHAVAVGAIAEALGPHAEDGPCFTALRAALSRDLASIGARKPPAAAHPPTDAHPLGLTYVVAGSRLGARVLHGQALTSPDERVRSASGYLAPDLCADLWARVKRQLETLAPVEAERERIISGAFAGFACFENALRSVREQRLDDQRQDDG